MQSLSIRQMKNLPRDDISNNLIHFTKPESAESADTLNDSFKIFIKILKEKTLLGGSGFIKGSYKCICFTEAPITKLPHMFSKQEEYDIRYAPYGIMFSKAFLYDAGARPVIYGPEDDYNLLPEDLKYRHVRYDPIANFPVDHTWEREWRLKKDLLAFTEADVTLVVPSRQIVDALKTKNAKWHCIALSDLGVPVRALNPKKV